MFKRVNVTNVVYEWYASYCKTVMRLFQRSSACVLYSARRVTRSKNKRVTGRIVVIVVVRAYLFALVVLYVHLVKGYTHLLLSFYRYIHIIMYLL